MMTAANTNSTPEKKLFGYIGKVLRINLTTGSIKVEPLDEQMCERYLGGSGFVAYYLWKELKAGVDALGPENKIVIATGPITGTPLMGSGRHTLGAKSPQTGGIALSQIGEFWGAEIKRAGFDIVIIEGKSEKPVYINIKDGKAEIKDAAYLWGMDTKETQISIRKEIQDEKARVLMIGPGGEKLVKFACIMGGLYDAAGRGGMGAVMGSKNLKAISAKGTGKIPVANPEKIKEIHKILVDSIEKVGILKAWHEAGTGFDLDAGLMMGDVPVHNWRDGVMPTAAKINAITLRDTMGAGMDGCFGCPMRCKKKAKMEKPYKIDPDYGGPEYESLGAFGANLAIDDLGAVVKANELCNAGSVDVISAGGVIAFCMEAWERGLLTKEQTDGLDLTWGNADSLLKCVQKITKREGFGNILAEGLKATAKWIGKGSEEFAMQVKNLDPGQHEPRLMPAMGLGFMVNPHGADHCLNVHDGGFAMKQGMARMGIFGLHDPIPADEMSPRKVAVFKIEYLRQALLDCLAMCHLSSVAVDYPMMVEIMNAVTGGHTGPGELIRIAERTMTVARLFNIREGFTDMDDNLPKRFFQPRGNGALAKKALDPEKMDKAKRYYYNLMGWDAKGVPLPERIEELYIE
jgi:aldehyde:ferredoxin oxidoreductase